MVANVTAEQIEAKKSRVAEASPLDAAKRKRGGA